MKFHRSEPVKDAGVALGDEESQRKHETTVERQLSALEAQARATGALAQAVTALAAALSGGGAPPPKAPAAAAPRPAGAAPEKPATKADVQRAMVAVAKARGSDFLTAYLKDHLGCESIRELRPEQYGEVLVALTTIAGRAAK